MKNIEDLYTDIKIKPNGEIEYKKTKSIIYNIGPLNIIERNSNVKSRIYDTYYSFLKGMTNEFKIIILKEKLEIEQHIDKLKQRALKVESVELKKAILNYVSNLENAIKKNSTILAKYYIIVPFDEALETKFKVLEEIGMSIRKVDEVNEIENVFKEGMIVNFAC